MLVLRSRRSVDPVVKNCRRIRVVVQWWRSVFLSGLWQTIILWNWWWTMILHACWKTMIPWEWRNNHHSMKLYKELWFSEVGEPWFSITGYEPCFSDEDVSSWIVYTDSDPLFSETGDEPCFSKVDDEPWFLEKGHKLWLSKRDDDSLLYEVDDETWFFETET